MEKIINEKGYKVCHTCSSIFIYWEYRLEKINYKSTDEIFQGKSEQFYENQESFESIVEYVNRFDLRSITENNEMWSDVKIDGITFRLEKLGREDYYGLSLYSTREVLLQLLNTDKKIGCSCYW